VVEDAGRGWRRVVASPEPREIVEQQAIDQAVHMGWIVVAVGGGGIPVVRNSQGRVAFDVRRHRQGSRQQPARRQIDADLFLISTGVEKVSLNFGKPNQQDLDQMTWCRGRAVYGGRSLCPRQHEAKDRSVHPLFGKEQQARRCLRSSPTPRTWVAPCAARPARASL
jgi:hypothetical protein